MNNKTQTIDAQGLINILAGFNPTSSFVTISYTTISKDHNKGAWGSRKALDKRDFEIYKTASVSVQVGSSYETRYNNKLAKEGKEVKKEFAKAWYSMVNGSNVLAVKKSDPKSFYIRGFETKRVGETVYHDEDGKSFTDKELEPYKKEKKDDGKVLAINVFGVDNITSITMSGTTYIIR